MADTVGVPNRVTETLHGSTRRSSPLRTLGARGNVALWAALCVSLIAVEGAAQVETTPGDPPATREEIPLPSSPVEPLDATETAPSERAEEGAVEDVAEEEEFNRFGIIGLPALSLNSDEGLGYGVVGTAYWYSPDVEPYRTAVTAMLSTTTRRVDSNWIEVDTLEPAGLPIRVRAEVGYFVTRTGTYCGTGGQVTCSTEVAETAARDLGMLPGTSPYDTFVNRYYQRRYRRPYGFAEVRWQAVESEPSLNLFANTRMSWVLPGDHDIHGPYPGSLHDQAFPDGDGGRWSTLQAGAMWDTRDYEPAPSSGYWVEASSRYAGPLNGSQWSFVGLNSILRGYHTLAPNLVLADRFVSDLIFGDAPLDALGTVGGSDDGRQALGGLHMGRGIRLQRNPGGLKLINQVELRWRFMGLGANPRSGLTLVGFTDSAWIATSPSSDDGGLLVSYGGGLRVALGDFVVRADIGTSAAEDYVPGFYILLRHTF